MRTRDLAVLGALAAGWFAGTAPLARADGVDDAARKLADLERRVGAMSIELKEAASHTPDEADRRVIDAQVLFGMKDYEEAATVCFDVVEKWPGTQAQRDALFLLGESLYQLRDLYSARRYFEQLVERITGTKQEQLALQRLVEIALRTGDYEHVEDRLAKLAGIPAQILEPSVPYVRGKYLFFTEHLDEAAAVFGAVPPSSPYYFQARYFLATVEVKKGDLAAASAAYDAMIKQKAPDDAAREIQNLGRLALGRILYDRSQFDQADFAYRAIGRESKYFPDALYELGWNYIKSKDFQKAYRAFDLLLLTNPDSTQAPELRILMGNLNLRLGNYFLAADGFTKTRDDFEPVRKQLQETIARVRTDPAFFNNLVNQNLDRFDITVFIPGAAAKWVEADAEVARMLALTTDVVDIQRALRETDRTLARLERGVATASKVGLFADLGRARDQSVSASGDLVALRQRLVQRARDIERSSLTDDEEKDLDQIAAERDELEREAGDRLFSDTARKEEGIEANRAFSALDARASELNVQIQGMEAELVAIEQYYKASRAEQKIAPEDLKNPTRDLRAALDGLRAQHERIRDEIADAAREAAVARAAGEAELSAARRLEVLFRQEQDLHARVRARLDEAGQREADRVLELLSRCDAVTTQLHELDRRIEDQAGARLAVIRETLSVVKAQLAEAGKKVGVVVGESQALGGGLAQAMFTRVADRFYDLVVRAEVGLIDVAWGMKDQKTNVLTRLAAQQKAELKAIDQDFRRITEEK